MQENYSIDYIRQLESESIHIIREVAASTNRPVLLYSIGKDSSVLLKLAQKAFSPGKIPFELLHIDTGFKFPEMIDFRDYYIKKIDVNLIVYKNESEEAMSLTSDDAHTDRYVYLKKTKPLLDALHQNNFTAAIGGARREEEKSRAKERIFSVRTKQGVWDPKNQRPELWHTYNYKITEKQSLRIFPISNWTEIDIWHYIRQENIEIVPLYFSQKTKVVNRHNTLIRIDEMTKAKKGEEVRELMCRYRTLGCAPSTGAIESTATTVEEIIEEIKYAKNSERQNRAIDQSSDVSMEQKKRQGYF